MPVYFPLGVDEDDCLCDGQGFIQITQCVQLPLLFLHIDVELTNTLQGHLLLLHKNADGVTHEFLGDFQNISRHRGREEDNLCAARHQHVKNTPRGSHHDLRSFCLQLQDLIVDAGPSNAAVAADSHVVTHGQDHLLDLQSQLPGRSQDQSLSGLQIHIDLLKNRNGKSGRLSSSRLGLSYHIVTLDRR
uniref:Uncharacterized protein n=1 Tax=Gouania willdenowi TaxID=441366 RepID=A0A8C5G665_GOUWI